MRIDRRESYLQGKVRTRTKMQKEIKAEVEGNDIRPTNEESRAARRILDQIAANFREDISKHGLNNKTTISKIETAVTAYCEKLDLEYETKLRIERLVMANIIGLGPIQAYMDDDSVTEIVVQRFDKICIERNGLVEKIDAAFMDEQHLRTIINRIVQEVGRQLNKSTPMVDARLEDGSRVNATIPPATPDGATLTIRKFKKGGLSGEDYVRMESMSQAMLDFLAECVRAKISLIVSGGTNTGKTTLLNMLSSYIPEEELIITIEDSCELQLHQSNLRRMETRPALKDDAFAVTIQSLVKNALRMRPDRIVVGEIRDETVVDMMSAMSTGHEGSMSTVHANSPANLVNSRLPILYSMYSGMRFSPEAQAMQISEALHLIIQIEHSREGKRRITHITHIAGLDENGKVNLKDIFRYRRDTNTFESTGYVPEEIVERIEESGGTIDRQIFESEGGKHDCC